MSAGTWDLIEDSIIKNCWKKANIMYQEIEIENEEIVGLNESEKIKIIDDLLFEICGENAD